MQKNKKMIIGGVAVASCIAAGAIYAVESNQNQFDTDIMGQSDYEFMSYVSKENKGYKTKAEYKMRKANWSKVNAEIIAHNADLETTSGASHNFMSDYTESELKNMRGYDGNKSAPKNYAPYDEDAPEADEIDWVTKGKVTPVQQQLQCGSCWTFSASGAISSARAIKLGVAPVDYSEQQIVDCDKTGNGCSGGLMDLAFKYVETNPLELSTNYPYTATQTACSYNKSKGTGAISSYRNVQVKKNKHGKIHPGPMKHALKNGPVSIGIDASSTAFNNYNGQGILNKGCGTTLDHGILAVGWGKEATSGEQYVLVKNQWGTTWGSNGFGKVHMHNGCGILQAASYPVV